MILTLSNSQDSTADYLLPILEEAGIQTLRLDTDSIISLASVSFRPGAPALSFADRVITPHDVKQIWYRRPERLKRAGLTGTPEGEYALDEWAESLEGFLGHIPPAKWLNHPSANAAASNKLQQLTTAQRLGLTIPDSVVTQDPRILREFFERHRGRIVCKPMASGYVEREGEVDTLMYTNKVELAHLASLDDLKQCPTLFQEYIEKTSDVRITVVDDDFHAVELLASENGSQRCDIRRNNMVDVEYRAIDLPASVASALRTLMAHYALRFSAIDMVIGANEQWYFLEVNPNGQWAWLDLCGASTICTSFVKSFANGR